MPTDHDHVLLLVEDDPADAHLTLDALSSSAAEVRWVRDGDEALEFLEQRDRHAGAPPVGLVVLDLNLPGRSGMEVLDIIRTTPGLRDIPVTVLSTSAAEQHVSDAYGRRANAYVTKPITLDDYFEAVASIERFWVQTVRLPRVQGGLR